MLEQTPMEQTPENTRRESDPSQDEFVYRPLYVSKVQDEDLRSCALQTGKSTNNVLLEIISEGLATRQGIR